MDSPVRQRTRPAWLEAAFWLLALLLLSLGTVRLMHLRAARASVQASVEILNHPLPPMGGGFLSLGNMIERVEQDIHAKIEVDWDGLARVEVFDSTPLGQVHCDTVRRALDLVVAHSGGRVCYRVVAGRIRLMPDIPETSGTYVYAYDVRDLVNSLSADLTPDTIDAIAPRPPLTRAVFGVYANPRAPGPLPPPTTTVSKALARNIESVVTHYDWQDDGGTTATMHVFPGWLVISHTAHGHAEIRRLLELMRRTVLKRSPSSKRSSRP